MARIENLALQIRQGDDIVIDHAQCSDTRRRQIQQQRGTQTTATDNENFRLEKTLLSFLAYFGQKDIARVTQAIVAGVAPRWRRSLFDPWRHTCAFCLNTRHSSVVLILTKAAA